MTGDGADPQPVRLMVVWEAISGADDDSLFAADSFSEFSQALPPASRHGAAHLWVWYFCRADDMSHAVRQTYRRVLAGTGTQPDSDGFDGVLRQFPELQDMQPFLLALHRGGHAALDAAIWADLKPNDDARYTPPPE